MPETVLQAPGESHYDVLIIGAGMAGMAAAIRLAHFGKKVCLLERHTVIGGLNSFYKLGGRKYDVGLHAVTNYVPRGVRGTPLVKLLRQLRIHREELDLCEQLGSKVSFPGEELTFTNDFSVLESEVARAFPGQVDGFRALAGEVAAFGDLSGGGGGDPSARSVIRSHITDRGLEDMLLCPLMYYGSAREGDMDYSQFAIMFQAVYLEGFARPFEGVRRLTRTLLRKLREAGAERCMGCGVRELRIDRGRVAGVILDSGREVTAGAVLSSAGVTETLRLCREAREPEPPRNDDNVGRLSFVESITVFRGQPRDLGCDNTIIFYNDAGRFDYSVPGDLVDPRSGVICFPNNFDYGDRQLPEGFFRITCLANCDGWCSLPEKEYRAQKERWFETMVARALKFLRPVNRETLNERTLARDMFTPRTITRYTGHINGAVYGAPKKVKDGCTPYENLFLCGTDQGFLGITGAMLSGISMANRHVLSRKSDKSLEKMTQAP